METLGLLAPTLFGVALLCCGINSTVTATLAGQIVMEGDVARLRNDKDIQSFYLGVADDGSERHQSFRDVKHYKRRKRWLS